MSRFPQTLAEVCTAWQLTEVRPFSGLTYHFVARARQAGRSAVLKLGVPDIEAELEARALAAFEGPASVRLLDVREESFAILLEDLTPGTSLESIWTEEADETQTQAIARLMPELWKAPRSETFPTLADWARAFDTAEPHVPAQFVDAAKGVFRELSADVSLPRLLHGDLHHGNVMLHGTSHRAIDPKGVVGDPAFEVYGLLRNPVGATIEQVLRLWPRRIAIVSEVTGIDRERLRLWGFVGTVISCCWSAEEGPLLPGGSLELARRLGGFVA